MTVGELLRDWRRRRHLSQLDLAGAAEVSARHLSFVETGRSKPSRELLVHLASHLDVPLREQNTLLLAAGYAPAYRETPLDDAAMAPITEALDKILTGHEPFPAVIINRRWELVRANAPLLALMDGVDPALLEPPVNVLRVSLHPDGLGPRIGNLDEWSAHLLTRLRREAMLSGDPALGDLYDELREYPGVKEGSDADATSASMLFVALKIDDLTFFSTVATFGTALDVTLAELSIEAFFPAGDLTR
ncbi:MAG: helix-turn-helix transcriptional regulator [Actinobacteria bacterium]|nr:helix-turn-helix transcriptional regulator [Actinomycetota bacterium]